MTRKEAVSIIEKEELEGYRFFEQRPYRADEVVVDQTDGKWLVYVISERCAKMDETQDEYTTESAALEDFIDRLRADKILRNLS